MNSASSPDQEYALPQGVDVAYERRRVALANNRTRRLDLPSTLTVKQWLATVAHFDGRCAYCGGDFRVLDHFVPVSQGGGTAYSNVVPACFMCNQHRSMHVTTRTCRCKRQETIYALVAAYLARVFGVPVESIDWGKASSADDADSEPDSGE